MTKERLTYSGITLVTLILVLLSFRAGLLSGPESALEDTLFSNRAISSDLVIVAIDDASIQEIGQWPWPRATFAKLLNTLAPFHPQAVGIDVLFAEASRLGAADDTALVDTLSKKAFPVALAAQTEALTFGDGYAHAGKLIPPLQKFGNQTTLGLVNVPSDADGIVRSAAQPIKTEKGALTISFAAALLKAAGHDNPTQGYSPVHRIVFSGPPGSVRTISAKDVLSGKASDLENKIILIGATAESLHDSQKTPVGGGTSMQGVEIHAQIANMYLKEYHLTPVPQTLAYAWMIFASILAMLLLLRVKRFETAIGANVGVGILYIVAAIIWFGNGTEVNIIHITLAWLLPTIALSLYRFFSSEKERRMIRHTFSKYVAPHVLNELLEHPERIALGGEEREITVLFSDIRGFTTLSEGTTPIELVRILNTYFSRVTKEIIDNDGVLDKYIGDAIMAFWGAPIENPHQADQAVEAALGMIRALEELNKEFEAKGDPQINIGIGIYTGKAVVGNIGSEHRFDYTVIGDTVNAASRIEGLTKEYKTHIIIGESTKNKLTKDFPLTPLGTTSVKGKTEQITIYGVNR